MPTTVTLSANPTLSVDQFEKLKPSATVTVTLDDDDPDPEAGLQDARRRLRRVLAAALVAEIAFRNEFQPVLDACDDDELSDLTKFAREALNETKQKKRPRRRTQSG